MITNGVSRMKAALFALRLNELLGGGDVNRVLSIASQFAVIVSGHDIVHMNNLSSDLNGVILTHLSHARHDPTFIANRFYTGKLLDHDGEIHPNFVRQFIRLQNV
jgi:hypothetical protein